MMVVEVKDPTSLDVTTKNPRYYKILQGTQQKEVRQTSESLPKGENI